MVKINGKKPSTKSMEDIIDNVVEKKTTKEGEINNVDLNSILERLDKVERENQELKKAKENPFKKAKEINDDPKMFSYKLWGGVPVLSFKSKRKDPTKDLVYKNQYGQYDSNHILELSLADGKKIDVDVIEFNKSFTRSEKMVATDHHGELIYNRTLPLVKEFTFKTEDYGTFTIMPNCIN